MANPSPRLCAALALFGLLTVAPALHAEDCSAYAFPTDVTQTQLATVTAARSFFLRDFPNCPEDTAACTTKSYVVRGDKVFTVRTHGAYTCAAFVSATRQTTGWLRTDTLAPAAWPAPIAQFTGAWQRLTSNVHESADLRFAAHGSTLSATLEASLAVSPGNVRTGGASGPVTLTRTPTGAPLATLTSETDDQCRVRILPAGDLLLVSDGATPDSNSACGGMGVTLSGIYRRAKR